MEFVRRVGMKTVMRLAKTPGNSRKLLITQYNINKEENIQNEAKTLTEQVFFCKNMRSMKKPIQIF